MDLSGDVRRTEPLTRESLQAALRDADYLTFTGHGGATYWRISDETVLEGDDLPDLRPGVFAAASCQTLRLWRDESIALGFVSKGAAAYVGFAYSPNEGFLIGEFQGLPLRYTTTYFPIGHAVAAQWRGTVQGFAAWPFYYLLGDPRIALADKPPYELLSDRAVGATRTIQLQGLPRGTVPVRIEGGAAYAFVQVVGLTAASRGDPFFNSRLQMVDIGPDKYLLVDQNGGDLTIRLRLSAPALWPATDLLLDSFDTVLLFMQRGGGDWLSLIAGCTMTAILCVRLVRRRSATVLPPALWIGSACALVHAVYMLLRASRASITTKPVGFSVVSVAATLLLVAACFALALSSRSRLGRILPMAASLVPSAGPAVLIPLVILVMNTIGTSGGLRTALYNYNLGLLAWPASLVELAVYTTILRVVRRHHLRHL